MNLNQIQYLLAIHKYGSITKAAQHLFVSAPSVSNAIKHLEEELNCTLLMRHYTGVHFTDEGLEAVQLMEEINERVQKLYHLQQDQDFSLAGEINVGVSLHAKAALFLPTYLKLKKEYPAITLNISDATSRDILKAILQGSLDLGIIHYTNIDSARFIDTIERNHLNFTPLSVGKMCFVVREGHPLTTYSHLTTKDVLQYPLLNYDKTDFTKAHYKFFQSYEPNCKIVQLSDRDLYRDLQHNSNAVITMPSSNAASKIKQFSGLSFLHVADFDCHYTIGWLHNSDPLTPAENAVTEALEQKAI